MAIPILAIIFGFVFFIVKMAMDHERAKLSLKAGSENSLTSSELKSMIESAVQEAVAPLEKRLDELTGEAPAALPEGPKRIDLDQFDEVADDEVSQTVVRQRAR